MSQSNENLRRDLSGLQMAAIAVGVIAALGAGYGWTQDKEQFWHAYLYAFFFWLAPTTGSLGLYMLHQLTGGRWGAALRRPLEAAMRMLPLMALFFIPVIVHMASYYPWAVPGAAEHDELLAHKAGWLNPSFFIVRAALYFAVWILLAGVMQRVSARRDTGDYAAAGIARSTSGPGFLLFALTLSFAVFDWAMSLEPHWFSTMYGAIFLVGGGLETMCMCILFGAWLRKRAPFTQVFTSERFHDLGTLSFAMVLLWAYTNFSQYLIIWSGNLNEETPWVHLRTSESWRTLALGLVVLHFALPFFLLLFRKHKQHAQILAGIAGLLVCMRFLDLYWYIGPAFSPEFKMHWLDLAVPLAMGGFWIALFLRAFKSKPFVSEQDLELSGSLQHAHH
ncbi:MAG: hypothetical protein IPJ19_15790 [Planctomycetes bacterium]|nr:hypothetical protein [Planctomycetota bacterium]